MNLLKAYLALVLLATPIGSPISAILAYWALAAGIFLMLGGKQRENAAERGIPHAALALPIGIIAISRMIPIIRWGGVIGLGADSAAYYMNFERCLETLIACAGTPVAFLAYPLEAIGMGPETMLIVLMLVAHTALGASLYVATRDYISRNAAFWSLLVFAISLPQFLAYWSFFLNMEIAMALTLCAMIAYRKRSPYAALFATLVGIIHFVTFVPLAMTLMILTLADGKNKRYAMATLSASCAGTLLYQLPDMMGYAENAATYATGSYGPEKALFLAGHFVSFSFYHNALMLFYLPFALIAIARSMRDGKTSFMEIYALVAIALVALHAIFQNRFVILFDLMAIALAGEEISRLCRICRANAAYAACSIVIMAALAGYALYESARMEPLMNKAEFAEVRALAGKYGTLPIFVNSPTYRQFLEGYGGHPAITASFSAEPWRTGKIEALIYNARRSCPFKPNGDPHYIKISNLVWKYEP